MLLVNGRFLLRRTTGVERYADRLIERCLELAGSELAIGLPGYPSTSILRERPWLRQARLEVAPTGGRGQIFEHLVLPVMARRLKARCLFHPANTVSIAPAVPQSCIFFDAAPLIYPSNYTAAFRVKYRAMLLAARRSNVQLFTASESSATLLRERFRGKTVTVLPTGPGLRKANSVNRPRTANKYALAYGSADPRKQLGFLAEQWIRQGLSRVLDLIVITTRARTIRAPQLVSGTGVTYRTEVSDELLGELITGAELVLYPSLYEGTAMAPLEALHHGARVVVTDIPVYHEQLPQETVFIAPDLSDLSQQVHRCLASPTPSPVDDLSVWRSAATTFLLGHDGSNFA